MNCLICDNSNLNLVIKNHPGYLDNTFYDIFYCSVCNTSQIDSSKYDSNIYEKIYVSSMKEGSIPGYDRYLKYFNEIKKSPNPFQYLINQESTYIPIYKFLKNKTKLKILEIGCGLGYLTYSIKNLGHDIVGIDVSSEAINKAKDLFGEYFICCDLLENCNLEQNSFDLIIGTELIEHLPNVSEYISKCMALLKPEGSIIFTTPNKSFYEKSNPEYYWITENPPVHVTWLSEKSFTKLAKRNNLNLEFLESIDSYFKNNHLVPWLYLKYIKVNRLTRSRIGEKNNISRFNVYKLINQLIDLPFIVYISNLIFFSIFGKTNSSIAVRLIKN